MMVVVLHIEAELCGPVSIGTVAVVKLLVRHLALGLGDALGYVNRCVFEGDLEVEIPAPSAEAAAEFMAALAALPVAPRVVARLGSS
jgi:hypothetical protein